MPVEFSMLDFIQAHFQCAALDKVMPLITALGNGGVFWILCTLILLIIPKTRRVGAVMALSLALEALCCNVILKPLVARTRPYDVNTAVSLLISKPSDFSFPSGHTSAAFAVASALYFSKNRCWIPAGILAVLIALSRLYLYVHYPTDVLIGALIGAVFGWAGYYLIELFSKKYAAQKM